MKLKNNQSGVAHLGAILAVVVIVAIGVVGWKVWDSSKSSDSKKNTPTTTTDSTKKSVPSASTDPLKLVQDTYTTTRAYVKRTSNADQGEIDSVKDSLSRDLYARMTEYLANQTDSGHDQFTCTQMTPDSYTVAAGTASNNSVPVIVTQKFGDTDTKVTYTVDLDSKKITAITCPQ